MSFFNLLRALISDRLSPFFSTFRGQFVVDELYLRRNHGFTDEQIRKFSMGGEDVPFDDLAEDLYISQELRDEIKKARSGN